MTLSAVRIQALLDPYYSAAPLPVCGKIMTYIDLLLFWGEKISLTAISDEEEIVRFHFGESIFALSLQNFRHGRLADVGSGAGFPGLAIKLFRPNLKITLLEPHKKKCAFLNEIIRELEFSDTEVLPLGFESSKIPLNELTYVVSRAMGQTEKLLSWSRRALRPEGCIVLWLGADDVTEIVQDPSWHWIQAPIPDTMRRRILVGIPQSSSQTLA